ncbi:MAG: ComF family protein [Archaeoglobaceae archaeon]|nr:ComF family protein [Archaeoglobaceae archaeon]
MNEIYLNGNWKAGWAIELHTLSSIPLGDGTFDTTYTETGESLHRLKYHNDFSQIAILAEKVVEFLNTRLVTPYLSAILPVPPSNLDRTKQPVYEIAKEVGKALNIFVDFDYLYKKKKTEQLKDISDPDEREKILKDAFGIKDLRYRGKKVLLFDDLYRSGATLREITKLLYEKGGVQDVYVLTLTKTRTKR